MTRLAGKKILLIIGGGIAAYKSLELIRLVAQEGGGVSAILTPAGAEFVTPMSVAALTGTPVRTELFDLGSETQMGHIELSRTADLVVVAPATADLMAKLASGLASDLASTTLLATDKQVLMAPSMNVRMWHHSATARNLTVLKDDGVAFVGPGEGDMACGEFGLGRLAEPEEILAAIIDATTQTPEQNRKPLAGRRALVTSGPTHEPIDPVRYLANRSSGKQGHAIAAALAAAGAETSLITGPVDVTDPPEVDVIHVETARDMLAAVQTALPADVAVFAAAVTDWRPTGEASQKLKKDSAGSPKIKLVENPDILATISAMAPGRPELVIGFAAETENLITRARAKMQRKACDWIVANDVSPGTGIMGGDRNKVHLFTADGAEDWPEGPKTEVAARLVARIAATLGEK